MQPLYQFHQSVIRTIDRNFTRFLYNEIHWDQRMLAIKGPRGAGKTTLMLQRLKFGLQLPATEALYITADHIWFYAHTLYETAVSYAQQGGKYLFIDEVHKYPNWSTELKNIYDGFPELRIIFSASSALDIYRGEADLSRRLITYTLPGLSFREFLELKGVATIDPVCFTDIINHHESIAANICTRLRPLSQFQAYLKTGALPIIAESRDEDIPARLIQIINAVLEADLAYTRNIDAGSVVKIKRLLGVIAESAPFKPNISSLARKLGVSRDSIYQWIAYLEHARVLNNVSQGGKGTSVLQKPDKVYLENTNFSYALKQNPDVGALRETFFVNQALNAGLQVTLPKQGDFLIDNTIVEVGGKNKTMKQIAGLKNAVIAVDDIEIGYGKKIPLWLFGLMY